MERDKGKGKKGKKKKGKKGVSTDCERGRWVGNVGRRVGGLVWSGWMATT